MYEQIYIRLRTNMGSKIQDRKCHCRSGANEWFFRNSEKIREADLKQDRYVSLQSKSEVGSSSAFGEEISLPTKDLELTSWTAKTFS